MLTRSQEDLVQHLLYRTIVRRPNDEFQHDRPVGDHPLRKRLPG